MLSKSSMVAVVMGRAMARPKIWPMGLILLVSQPDLGQILESLNKPKTQKLPYDWAKNQ